MFILLSMWFVAAQNVNKLKIEPDVSTGKYYCNFDVEINTEHNWANHTNCQYLVEFNTWDVGLSYGSRGSAFNSTDAVYYTGSNSNILAVEEKNSAEITTDVTCSTLNFWNKTTNPGSVLLKFVDYWGNDPTIATFIWTNDKLNLSLAWADTLTGIVNVVIPFEMCPCNLDWTVPFADTSTLTHSQINGWQLVGVYTSSVLFIDDGWSAWGYWYNGAPITTGNYTNSGLPAGMDNQEWVNSSTLAVTIDYSAGYGVSDDFFNSAALSPVAYTWTIANRPTITWDNNNRWYWVSFTNTTAYAVEQPVTITITGFDNALLGNTPCTRVAQMWSTPYTFNASAVPVMNNFSPANNDTFITPSISQITLEVSDTWAGVDIGKVWVTVQEINSWGQILLTWYTYSGTDLTFSGISGTPWIWNAWWYHVSFVPRWDFPTNTGIYLSGIVVDLAWYTWVADWSFTTRPDCDFYGCNEILDIYIMEWTFSAWSPYQFTWELLIVTGTNINSPYPYLTWINNDILMCGFPYTWANFDSNFDMFELDWTTPLLPYAYTWEKLYITWLDFTYSNGVITVN